jgi:hypothetical protein
MEIGPDRRAARQTTLAAGLALSLTAWDVIQPQLAVDPTPLGPATATKPWLQDEATRIPEGKATLEAFSSRSEQSPAAIQSRATCRI